MDLGYWSHLGAVVRGAGERPGGDCNLKVKVEVGEVDDSPSYDHNWGDSFTRGWSKLWLVFGM